MSKNDKNYPIVTGKLARERAERGFSSRDTWSFDYYISFVLAGYFANELKNAAGVPCTYYYKGTIYSDGTIDGRRGEDVNGVVWVGFKKLRKNWRKAQKLMRDGFRLGADDSWWYTDEAEANQALLNEALEHFAMNFGAFWN